MEYANVGMEGILVGKSRFAYSDKETEIPCQNKNIRCYNDRNQYRFVYYKNKRAVSGIHVQINAYGQAVIHSAFTFESHRRKGYAREIFNEAKKHFKKVHHSSNLSVDGKAFAQNVN